MRLDLDPVSRTIRPSSGKKRAGVRVRTSTPVAVFDDARLDHVLELEGPGRHRVRPVAADQDLERLGGDLAAHRADRALGDHRAAVDHDHPVRDQVDLVQDVARDDDVAAPRASP
jgi:hypothetical protein